MSNEKAEEAEPNCDLEKEIEDCIASNNESKLQDILWKFISSLDSSEKKNAKDGDEMKEDGKGVEKVTDFIFNLWKKHPDIIQNVLVDIAWLHGCTKKHTSLFAPSDAQAATTRVTQIISSFLQKQHQQQQQKPSPSLNLFHQKLSSSLDISLLQDLNFLHPPQPQLTQDNIRAKINENTSKLFVKRLRFFNTALNYKQTKYNIMHEEPQGYAKLLLHLLQRQEGDNNKDGNDNSSSLVSFIGAFDLDPNRVLDLLVDALQLSMGKEENQQREARILDLIKEEFCFPSSNTKEKDVNNDKSNNHGHLQKLKIEFHDKLCTLLHFKLSWHRQQQQQQQEKSPPMTFPRSLYHVIVTLARHDLIRLSHLVSTSSSCCWTEIKECFDLRTKVVRQQISNMMRTSLNKARKSDSDINDVKQLEERINQLQQNNLVVGLITVLLDQEDWNMVESQLLRWQPVDNETATTNGTPRDSNGDDDTNQWTMMMCALFPRQIGKKLAHWVGMQLQEFYKAHVPMPQLVSPSSNDTSEKKSTKKQRIANDRLLEIIKSCSSPLAALASSGCLARHAELFVKVCRILRVVLSKNQNLDPVYGVVIPLFESALLPSLSMSTPNPALTEELWLAMVHLPYSRRYQLYNSWVGEGLERRAFASFKKNPAASKPLLQIECEIQAGKNARYALKRLSIDTLREMGRLVSKVTHSNPLVVFTTILNQIESYDNMIEMMVDALKFVTPLGLDVLGYCILSRLSTDESASGDATRNRLKEDGVNVSQWLQSLEAFASEFYKRFPAVEVRGTLCYLQHRLKAGNVLELGVLKSMISKVGGFGFADYSLSLLTSTLEQLEGRAGSQRLQRETFAFGVIENYNREAAKRLQSVFHEDNGRMGITILICLAQIRNRLIFKEEGGKGQRHVKLVGNLLDTCQGVLSMLLEFMISETDSRKRIINGEEDDGVTALSRYANAIPSLEKLLEVYALDTASCWMLYRPVLSFRASNESKSNLTSRESENKDREKVLLKMFPEKVFSALSPSLMDSFFTHSLSDIFFPSNSYERVTTRLKREEERLSKQKANQPNSFKMEEETDLQRFKKTASIISQDAERQKAHCEATKVAICSKAPSFFTSNKVSVEGARTMLQYCTMARCTTGPEEAMYCVKFMKMLHVAETPGFGTLHYIDEFIKMVSGSIYRTTENESAALGIGLLEVWKLVSHWRYDEGAYGKEVEGKPGSYMIKDDDSNKAPHAVSFENFQKLYNKWHCAIGSAALGCFDRSTEYMHLRACLIILNRIVHAFPTRPRMGERILEALEPLQEDEYHFQDIKAAAQAYASMLIQARNNGVWQEEDAAAAEARRAEEKAAAEAMRKRRDKQMAEMDRDMKDIDNEIGDDRRDDWIRRGGGNGNHGDNMRTRMNPDVSSRPRGGVADRKPDSEPNRRDGARNSQDRSDDGRNQSLQDHHRSRSTENMRGRGNKTADEQQQQQSHGSLQGRWQRGNERGTASKRDRSPERGENQHHNKRHRSDGSRASSSANSSGFDQRGGRDHRSGGERTGGGGFTRRNTQRRG